MTPQSFPPVPLQAVKVGIQKLFADGEALERHIGQENLRVCGMVHGLGKDDAVRRFLLCAQTVALASLTNRKYPYGICGDEALFLELTKENRPLAYGQSNQRTILRSPHRDCRTPPRRENHLDRKSVV